MALQPVLKKPEPPIRFKRGSTFSFALNIPSTLPDGYFQDWEVSAHIRREGDSTPRGLVAALGSRWENSLKTRRLFVFHSLTDKWPLGPADMDLVLTNGSGFRLRTKTVKIIIERGVTQ